MKKNFSVFIWLIIWLIVGIAGFFISKFLYSIPFFYQHDRFTFCVTSIICVFVYYLLLKLFYKYMKWPIFYIEQEQCKTSISINQVGQVQQVLLGKMWFLYCMTFLLIWRSESWKKTQSFILLFRYYYPGV